MEALCLVTGIPTPSAASRARVVSPAWSERVPGTAFYRRCQKVYAVYERAEVRAMVGEAGLPLAA